MLSDYKKNILTLLEQLELEISHLYKLFADKFSSHKELWIELSNDEINHAAYIRKLSSFCEQGLSRFNEKTTNPTTIKIICDGIKSNYEKAQGSQYMLINALAYGLSLEESVIENKFYDYFSSDNPDVFQLITKVNNDTRLHATKIKQALEEEKKRR